MFKKSLKTLLQIRKIRQILPSLTAIAFQRNRYIIKWEWVGNDCWTHNAFMLYHWFFGKACHTDGNTIRPAGAVLLDFDGKQVGRKAFTIEQACAHFEGDVRAAFAKLKSARLVYRPVYIEIPVFAGFGTSWKRQPVGYSFAIAYDQIAQLTTQGASPHSGSATTSGSDRFIVTIPSNGSAPTITAHTYNSVAMTLGQNYGTQTGGFGYYHQMYYQANPTTGTNTVSFAWTGGGNGFNYVLNYTGVLNIGASSQVGLFSADQAYDGSKNCFNTVTVPSSNGWVVFGGSGDGSLGTGVYNSVGIQRTSNGVTWMFGDSNGTIASGSRTFGYTNSSGTKGALIMFGFGADAPAAAGDGLMIGHFA